MPKCEIRDLKQFLGKCLSRTVVEYKLADLTKAGDNYGSIIQSLEVIVVDANDGVSKNFRLFLQKSFFTIFLRNFSLSKKKTEARCGSIGR